jgi:hypothetical protein
VVETPCGSLQCANSGKGKTGGKVLFAVKPEDIQLFSNPSESLLPGWSGKVEQLSFLGGFVDYRISVGELTLRARVHPSIFFRPGEKVHCFQLIGSVIPITMFNNSFSARKREGLA